MNIEIFKIGSLQFQPFKMIYLDEETLEYPFMSFCPNIKKTLPSDIPVINCHIQYGANLGKKQVDESFEKALSFFRATFPSTHYRAFICYSWLLYEPMNQYLTNDSNIKYFYSKFNIIGSCSDIEQSRENLFINKCENMSSLQKEFIRHKETFGYACGMILI